MATYVIVLDTETCPLDPTLTAVVPSNMFPYDKGYAVIEKGSWKIMEMRSLIIKDVFFDEPELMNSAYYANKIPQYLEGIANGSRKVVSAYEARQQLLRDIKKYNVKEIYAHNARFDLGALNNSYRWNTKSKYRYYFPKNCVICDTLKMSRDVIGKMPTYRKFCEENGFMTKHSTPRPQLTAEVIYRFIIKDPSFVESHTALEDVMIEKEILAYCYKQHKKMRKALYE